MQGAVWAQLAIDMYIHRLSSFIRSMIASLEDIDILVFTGGVCENFSLIRKETSEAFAFLQMKIDLYKNEDFYEEDVEISVRDSKIKIFLILMQEAFQIGEKCRHSMVKR